MFYLFIDKFFFFCLVYFLYVRCVSGGFDFIVFDEFFFVRINLCVYWNVLFCVDFVVCIRDIRYI